MKRLFTMLTCFLATLSISVHGQILSEGFEGGIPATWAVFDSLDAGGQVIGTNDWTSTAASNTGTGAAYCSYGANLSANFLATPQVTPLTGQSTLSFYHKDSFTPDWGSKFQVRVSTASQTDIADYTTILASFQESDMTNSYTLTSVDLSAYIGTPIYIAFVSIEDDGDSWYIDDVMIGTPTCLDPSALTASSITTSQAEIAWTENGTATSWTIEYGPTGFTPGIGTGTIVTTSNNPATITGLTSSTEYDFYVTAVCGVGDESAQVGSVSFTTLCGAITPAYLTDFSTFMPTCWDEASTGSPSTVAGTLGAGDWAKSGSSARINLYTNTRTEWLLSPEFDLSAGGFELVLNTKATNYSSTTTFSGMGSDDVVQVVISTDGGASWSVIHTWDASNLMTVTASDLSIDLTAYTGTSNMFGIWASDGTVDDGEDYYVFINSFQIRTPPTCSDVSALAVSNVTSSQAELAWTENGSATSWSIEYGAAGFTPGIGTGTIVTTSNNPETITGLTATTDYEFYVTAICGVGDESSQVGPASFTTPCAVITPAYLTDFSTFMPTCWEEASAGSPSTGATTLGSGDWSKSGSSARINLYTNTRTEWLLSPEFDLSAGGFELVLNTKATNYSSTTTFSGMGSDDVVQVVISTDGGTSWSVIHTWDASNLMTVTASDLSIDLAAYTGTSTMFGIWASDGTVDDGEDYYVYINSFQIRTPPTCPDVSALAVSNVTTSQAELAWTENGSATSWSIEYGAAGFTPGMGTGTIVTTSNNPETITGLSASTDYEFYVTAICGPGDESVQVGPASFATLCGAVMAPWTESFSGGSTPNCWTESGEAYKYNTSPGFGATSTVDYTSGGGTNYAWIDGSTPNSASGNGDTLTSPEIDLSGLTSAHLCFALFSNNDDNAWNNTIKIELFDGAAWNTVATYQQNFGPTWAPFSFDLSSYSFTGNAQVRFVIITDNNVNAYYNDILIDDVSFNNGGCAQFCIAPTSLMASNLTTSSADLSWTENGSAATWVIEYGAPGFTPGDGSSTSIITSNNPETLTGLSADTDYDFYITAICGAGAESSQVGAVSFTTIATCPAPSALSVSNITAMQAELAWTENGSATSWSIEYGAPGFTPGMGTGTIVTTSNNPETITGLSATTDYEFYVTAICGVGDESSQVGAVSFTTPCAVITPAYLTDFSTFMPTCWEEASAGSPSTGATTLGLGDWSQSGSSARVNLYNTSRTEWLLSPEFDLSAGGWELVLNAKAGDYVFSGTPTTFSGMGSDDVVDVVISTDGGASWNVIHTWDASNAMTLAASDLIIDLAAYSGTSNMFGIWASDGTVDDGEDYYVYINSFEIRTPTLSYSDTTVEVSCGAYTWAQTGVEYTTTGFYYDSLTTVNTGLDSVLVLDLTINPTFENIATEVTCATYTWGQTGMAYTTTGMYYDSLVSLVTGCDSVYVLDLTINPTFENTATEIACGTYTWGQTGMAYTTTGMYYDSLVSLVTGCDSVYVLDLTINTVGDLTTSSTGTTITATNNAADAYQWIDCMDNSEISGATASSYTATVTGDYAVVITNNSCSDTSACVTIDVSGVDENNALQFSVYPNPNNGLFNLETNAIGATLTLISIEGRIIKSNITITSNKTDLNFSGVESGTYLIKIQKDDQVNIERIVIR